MQPADTRAAAGLLVLRITLAYFLLLWSLEKLITPAATIRIAKGFYGAELPVWGSYLLGVAELALALALLFGAFRTITYALSLAVHTVTILVSYRRMFDPMALIANHLWISTWPTWGGFVALFLMRNWDAYSFDGWRARRI